MPCPLFLPTRLASNLTDFIHFLELGCTWLLKLNHDAYSYLLLQLAFVATASTYYLQVGLSHAPCPSPHFPKTRTFFLSVSRLVSKLTYFVHFLVLGCTWLLNLNHSAYSHMLFRLGPVVAASTHYLWVGLSHTRAHLFPKHIPFFTRLQIGT